MRRNVLGLIAGILLAGMAVPHVSRAADKAVGVSARREFRPVAAGPTGHAALFVGVNQFTEDPSLATLHFAVNDAVAMAHLFVIELKLVAPDRTILALSGSPTGADSIAAFKALQAAGVKSTTATKSRIFVQLRQVISMPQREEDLLILSLSSHGFEEKGVPYVMPADGVKAFLADTAINLSSIEQALEKSKAGKRLLLLDACREKPIVGGRGGGAMPEAFRTALAVAAGQAVMASCDVGQTSFEDPETEHGIFTYYLLEALRGRATPDAQGLIRLDNVMQYVSAHVESWSKRQGRTVQQPWFKGPQIARLIPLAVDPNAAKALNDRLKALKTLALDGKLSVEHFKEAERLFKAGALSGTNLQRRQVYERLAAGQTDPATAKLALRALSLSSPSPAIHKDYLNLDAEGIALLHEDFSDQVEVFDQLVNGDSDFRGFEKACIGKGNVYELGKDDQGKDILIYDKLYERRNSAGGIEEEIDIDQKDHQRDCVTRRETLIRVRIKIAELKSALDHYNQEVSPEDVRTIADCDEAISSLQLAN